LTTVGTEPAFLGLMLCNLHAMMTELTCLQSDWYFGKANRKSVVCSVSVCFVCRQHYIGTG